jgi:hypothetical protein
MDIPINAQVNCSDGPCGQSALVILKPSTEEITHLVVTEDTFPEIDYLVSLDQIAGSAPDHIDLKCSRDELDKMPVYDRVEFVTGYLPGFLGNPYGMWPYYAPVSPKGPLEKEHIPDDELVIRHGARVEASDGHAGRVDEFLVNPANDRITDLVLREGFLWRQKDVLIPVEQIDYYKGNAVYLKLNKQAILTYPGFPVWPGRARRT